MDHDSGGWVIGELERNLRISIKEKAHKIKPYRSKYKKWWLVLVDHIDLGVDLQDRATFRSEALAAFISVHPRIKQSVSLMKGRSGLSRAGYCALRHALYMPAMVALKYNPSIRTFGERLKTSG